MSRPVSARSARSLNLLPVLELMPGAIAPRAGRLSMLAIASALLLLGAGGSRAEGQAATSRSAEVELSADARLHIDVPVGVLRLVGTESMTLKAVMDLDCDASERRCARLADEARFEVETDGRDVYLRVMPGGMNDYNDLQLTVRIEVPAVEQLALQFGAGELEVRDVRACTSLRMFAGEAQIYTASDLIGEARLDVSVGEALLYLDNRTLEGDRSFLVGSKVKWSEGRGSCALEARLRFGELVAHLGDE
jgi:hypothetical protein